MSARPHGLVRVRLRPPQQRKRLCVTRQYTASEAQATAAEDAAEAQPSQQLLAGKQAVVIGGGPAGMVAAMQLAKNGARVRVFETRKFDYDERQNLWLILINERGLNALEAAGIDTSVVESSRRYLGAVTCRGDGSTFEIKQPDSSRRMCGTRGAHTKFAQQKALELYPDSITLLHECKLLGGDLQARSLELENLATGERFQVSADLIVGADGARSTVRQLMAAQVPGFSFDEQPHYSSIHAFAAPKAPKDSEASVPIFPPTFADKHWQKEGHSITFCLPKQGGKALLVLNYFNGVHASSLLSMPHEYWERKYTKEEARALISADLPQLPEHIVSSVANVLVASPSPSRLPTSIRCNTLAAPGVILLGDAAHAISPNSGQGVNSGLEDSLLLAQAIQEARGDIDEICGRFSALRVADARALVDLDRAVVTSAPAAAGWQLAKLLRSAHLTANSLLFFITRNLPKQFQVHHYQMRMGTGARRYSDVLAACRRDVSIVLGLILAALGMLVLMASKALHHVAVMQM